jgi:Uma2 family endonuclease
MSTIERIERLSLQEYARLYEHEGPFELIDGERRPLMPPVVLHGLFIRALFRLLDAHCTLHNLGEVITEMPYVLVYDSNWVKGSRVPDLMFFSAVRWQKYISETDAWEGKPFVLVPDLVVEVVSPNDLYTDIQDKVDRYLADGVRLIWVIDPQRKRVSVYEGERHTTLGEDTALTAGDVIPDLSISLVDLFQAITQAKP